MAKKRKRKRKATAGRGDMIPCGVGRASFFKKKEKRRLHLHEKKKGGVPEHP